MKAEEIRERFSEKWFLEYESDPSALQVGQVVLLLEIAAQLAEMNRSPLVGIRQPPMAVLQSRSIP